MCFRSRASILALVAPLCITISLTAQEATADAPVKPAVAPGTRPSEPSIDRQRVLGVLPNWRTADGTVPYVPLTNKRKLYIGFKDSTDYPVYPFAAVFAGIGQLSNANASFGQGFQGYAKRYGTTYADQVIGNVLAESLLPIAFKEDPRYFRIATGTTGARTRYALSRIFITKLDKGGTRFNFSETVGVASTVAISNLYSPDQRNYRDNLMKFGQQLGIDAISNVLKEFWPDIQRKYFPKKVKH